MALFFNSLGTTPAKVKKGASSVLAGIVTGNMPVSGIPDGVTKLRDYCFKSGYFGTLVNGKDTPAAITVPASVQSFGTHCFDDCGFSKITFKGSLTELPAYTFYNAYELTEIDWPTGLTSIGDFCFNSTDKLTSLKFPSTVTTFGKSIIQESSITELWMPASLKTVPTGSFNDAEMITKLHLPEGIEEFGASCFDSLGSSTTEVVEMCLPKSTKTIHTGAFSNMGSDTAGVKVCLTSLATIEKEAFDSNIVLFDCTAINTVNNAQWFTDFINNDAWGSWGTGKNFYFDDGFYNTDDGNLYPYTADFPKTTWGQDAYNKYVLA